MKAGARIGSYDVLSPLGAGGMGEVWRAHDSRIHRDVAIKFLPEDLAASPERLQRFEQEAQAAGALNHPNILTVFELGNHEGRSYLVTELLEGTTLREKLGNTRRASAAGARLPLRKALDYGAQMASGLAAAHEKGIVHRDLKPENVFVTTDGRVKILDFGLAKLTGVAGDDAGQSAAPTMAQPTLPGTVLGTVGYMAPEQVRGAAVDARADIFACGAVLYEMLSGRRAFEGASSADTMSAILKEDPPEAGAEAARVPVAVDRIVRRCLEKEAAQRFQSARDLAFALEAVAGSSSSSGHAEAVAPDGRDRRFRLPLALAAVAVVVAAAAAFWAGGTLERGRGGAEVQFTPLTFRPLVVFEAAFAPDERTVVFSAAEKGTVPSLYSVSADYPEPRAIGLPGAHLLAISSKGEMAVLTEPRYVFHRLFEGTLARVQLGSTAPRRVLERVRQAAWSPDGNELAVIRDVLGVDQLEFPVGRVLHRSAGYLSDLKVSPSGDRIAFFEHPARFDDRGSLVVVDLSGRASTLARWLLGRAGHRVGARWEERRPLGEQGRRRVQPLLRGSRGPLASGASRERRPGDPRHLRDRQMASQLVPDRLRGLGADGGNAGRGEPVVARFLGQPEDLAGRPHGALRGGIVVRGTAVRGLPEGEAGRTRGPARRRRRQGPVPRRPVCARAALRPAPEPRGLSRRPRPGTAARPRQPRALRPGPVVSRWPAATGLRI